MSEALDALNDLFPGVDFSGDLDRAAGAVLLALVKSGLSPVEIAAALGTAMAIALAYGVRDGSNIDDRIARLMRLVKELHAEYAANRLRYREVGGTA